jgi:hypothetical protein
MGDMQSYPSENDDSDRKPSGLILTRGCSAGVSGGITLKESPGAPSTKDLNLFPGFHWISGDGFESGFGRRIFRPECLTPVTN